MGKRNGFTLLELMIVVIILAILVIVAIPIYTRAVERGRRAEALTNLGALRSSEIRYYTSTGKSSSNFTGTPANWELDIDNPNGGVIGKRFYDYSITGAGGGGIQTVEYVGTRNTVDNLPGWGSGYTVTLDVSGNFIGGP